MKKKLFIALTAASALFAATNSWADAPGVTDSTVTLGEVIPLTGPPSLIGIAEMLGSVIAVEEVNAAGGINGRKVVVVREDDGYVPSRSVQAAIKLINVDNVFAFTNSSGTSHTLAVMEVLGEDNIPLVNAHAPATAQYTPPRHNVFVVGQSYTNGVKAMIRYMANQKKGAKWATVTQDDEYGSELRVGYEAIAKELDLDTVVQLKYKRGQKDFSAEMLRVKEAGATAMLNGGIISEVVGMAKEAHKLGLNMYAGTVWTGRLPIVQKLVGEAGQGLITVDYVATLDEPAGRAFVEKAKKYLLPEQIEKLNRYSVSSYVGMQLTFEAIRNCGNELTRECFISKMEEIKDFDTGGLMGPVSFGKGVRFTNQKVRMIMSDVANKKFVPLTDF